MWMKTMFSFRTRNESSLMYVQSEKYFFFCKYFWFWSLEMQMKTIFMLYMNHSWFEAWRLNSSNQSITFVIRCFIQSLSLSLLNTFRKTLISSILLTVILELPLELSNNNPLTIFHHLIYNQSCTKDCIPQITSLLSKRIDLYREWPIFRPKVHSSKK